MHSRLLVLTLFFLVVPPIVSSAEEAAPLPHETETDAGESGAVASPSIFQAKDGVTAPEQPTGGADEMDSPAGAGGIKREVIARIIRGHNGEIKACYERRLVEEPELAGRITTYFLIGPEGAVVRIQAIGDETGDVPLVECVADVISRMRFPPPVGGGVVRVTYPFHFSAAQTHTSVHILRLEPQSTAWPPEVVTERVEALAAHKDAVRACMHAHRSAEIDTGPWRGAILEISPVDEVEAALVGVPEDSDLGVCLLGVLQGLRFQSSSSQLTVRGTVSLGALVAGPRQLRYDVERWAMVDLIDSNAFSKVVEAHTPWARLCYLEHRRDCACSENEVEVVLTIDGTGTPVDVDITGTGEDSMLESCIARAVGNMSFSTPTGDLPVKATYRWFLEAPPDGRKEEAGEADLASAIATSPSMERCRRLRYRSREAVGDRDLGVFVAPDGRVLHTAILNGEPSPLFENCLREAVSAVRFPEADGHRLVRVTHRSTPERSLEVDRFKIRTARRAPGAFDFSPFEAPSAEGTLGVGAVPHTGHPVPEGIVGQLSSGRLALRFRMKEALEGDADVLFGSSDTSLLALSLGLRGRVLRGGGLRPDLALAGGLSVTARDFVGGMRLAALASWLTPGPLAIHAHLGGLIWHQGRENLVLQPALGVTSSLGRTTSIHFEVFAVTWTAGGIDVHRGRGLALGVEHRLSDSISLALSGDLYGGPDGPTVAARLSAGWRRPR